MATTKAQQTAANREELQMKRLNLEQGRAYFTAFVDSPGKREALDLMEARQSVRIDERPHCVHAVFGGPGSQSIRTFGIETGDTSRL